ncbi:hypothetical protein M436DRAFT_76898 [Aureobasidium namibiae CBS 147.97]|uniref:Uncharacterized protein n=1 Tax=Aureobasidium namibiae CBS 147.97 TaxID=1043004 RepID=A0A074WA82_9PEZI|nr:uncharacterized protein M436DRAFT_76898 [Aureobasidium namibiae CBS 147.97]KEQ68504.1 hypothetical protein M436DRAFT_76898 [Aureobasidium namibiae CBS 147.97]
MSRLQTRTANSESSIWRDLPENTFRQHLVDLEKITNSVPVEPQTFPLVQSDELKEIYTLPLSVEQQVADDFAFLAAIEEGAQSVAAVCLEEHLQPARLTVRFAALDLSLNDQVRDALNAITHTLSTVSEVDDTARTEELFSQIVDLHFRRLLARLRSTKWEKPKYLSKQHKKPLWQDFTNLLHRVQFVYTKKEAVLRRSVEAQVQQLAAIYESFEAVEAASQEEQRHPHALIKASYGFCKTRDIADFAQRLENSITASPTPKVASAIKCLRQVEKIGAYWRVTTSLIAHSIRYPTLFGSNLQLAFLTPYEAVATDIGHEAWAKSCHVHAEVQLAVHYDLISQHNTPSTSTYLTPRVIGTSKWLCYLCWRFLIAHGGFAVVNTHGRLYDQWTIPDLEDYGDEMCRRYRGIVRDIDAEVVREMGETGHEEAESMVRWRAEPMTSRQNLLDVDGKC